MKKAKDYAEQFVAAGKTEEALITIIKQMVFETSELMKIRRAQSNEAMFAIFNEIDEKYRSFALQVGGVRPYGFAIGVRNFFPDVYMYWVARFPNRAIKATPPPLPALETVES